MVRACLLVGILVRVFVALHLPLDDLWPHPRTGAYGFNDEPAHLNYVRYLVTHKELAVQTENFRQGGQDFEYYQPPLAYIAMAPFYWVGTKIGSPLETTRMFNVVLSILLIFAAREIARVFSPRIADATVVMMSLFPSEIYFSVLVSNDPPSWLLASAVVLLVLRSPEGFDRRRALLATALLTVFFYTKSSATTLLPLLFAPVFSLREKADRKRAILTGLAIVGAVAVLTLPWHLRNLRLYDSIFAFDVGAGPAIKWSDVLASDRRMFFIIRGTLGEFVWPFKNRLFDTFGFRVVGLFAYVFAFTLFLVGVRRGFRTLPKWHFGVIVVQASLSIAGYWYWIYTRAEPEPRLFYGCLPALCIAVSAGLLNRKADERDAAGHLERAAD